MPHVRSWLYRSIVALVAAGACASALAATPAQIGVFRDGEWFLDANGNGVWDGAPTDIHYVFGKDGDIPVVGDWNGDGITKIGVYRGGYWYLDYNGNGVWDEGIDKVYVFGAPWYRPAVGDWNKDGRTKIGVVREIAVVSPPYWWLDSNGNGVSEDSDLLYSYGETLFSGNYFPVVGYWNGDGREKFGTFVGGHWLLDLNGNSVQDDAPADIHTVFGQNGDLPVVGDWDGSGVSRIGIFRDGQWALDLNGNGVWDGTTDRYIPFGSAGDKPVVGKRWK